MIRPPERTKKPPAKAREAKQARSYMSPDEFREGASWALGGRGWQRAWTQGTGQTQSTISRYLNGVYPIPKYVAVIVELLATCRRNGFPMPESFSAGNLPVVRDSTDKE